MPMYPGTPMESARQIGNSAFAGAQQARGQGIELRAGAARALAAKRDVLMGILAQMRQRHTVHKQEEQAARKRKESLGLSAGGTAGGAAAGAAIGSIIPGIGTLAGAALGSSVGGGLGNIAGGNPVAGVQQVAGGFQRAAERLDELGDPLEDDAEFFGDITPLNPAFPNFSLSSFPVDDTF